jgi:hypothetical protein
LEVFVFSPLHFGVTSFFIGGLCFEPMNEGCDDAPSFVALAYLPYQLLLNIELALLAISTMVINVFGNKAYIIASGLHGLHLNKKPHTLAGFPCQKKSTCPEKVNARSRI